jgi:hypothetical protein
VEILHTWANGETEVVTIEVNVEANCAVQTWTPLLELESPIHNGDEATFPIEQIDRELELDEQGQSWNDICGTAEISLESSNDSIYLD